MFIHLFINPFSKDLLSNSNAKNCIDAEGLIKNKIDFVYDVLKDLFRKRR